MVTGASMWSKPKIGGESRRGIILSVLAPIVLAGVVTRFSRRDRWE